MNYDITETHNLRFRCPMTSPCLQALLKMSGGDRGEKTEVVREDRRQSREKKEDNLNRSNKTETRTEIKNGPSPSRSGNSRSHEEKTDRRLSSDHESYKRSSKSRSPTKLRRSRTRSRSRSRRSYDESRKENSQSSRYSRHSTVSRSRGGRSRSRSRESKNRKSTRINRAALVRDREVEDECKTLVENNLSGRETVQQKRLQPTPSEKLRQTISSERKKAAEEDWKLRGVRVNVLQSEESLVKVHQQSLLMSYSKKSLTLRPAAVKANREMKTPRTKKSQVLRKPELSNCPVIRLAMFYDEEMKSHKEGGEEEDHYHHTTEEDEARKSKLQIY